MAKPYHIKELVIMSTDVQIESKFADKNGEIMIVELGGHVDQSNSSQLQKMFNDILESGVFKVIVDFTELHYMSSAGWGIFVGEVKRFRENGGDIKLAAMNPEINDVYQMLEFFHILDDFNTVEEAAQSFESDTDLLDIVGSGKVTELPAVEKTSIIENKDEIVISEESTAENDAKETNREMADVIELVPGTAAAKPVPKTGGREFNPLPFHKEINLAELPLPEKIKAVISETPLASTWQIKKVLKHEHFGRTRISIFKLWKILKDLDLNSREKRYRFYRSC